MKFKIGDKIQREIDIYNPERGMKTGVIIQRYSKPFKNYGYTKLGPYPELYKVKWNNGKIEEGFLPHGLDFIKEKP